MSEDLEQGLTLMAAGMGTVFVLLGVLVWLVVLVSKLSRLLEPTIPAVDVSPRRAAPASSGDAELVGVISAAVKAHRERQSHRPP
jgi:oxaloacetate decarboxylase gamma subunit